ncbi:MAG: hypothetical protein ACKVP0_00765 [Pirellulaceae bacterium]
MNCEDFLEALVSSEVPQQSEARDHVNSCSNCAKLAEIHARLQHDLASSEPLPQRMRAIWQAAADESMPNTSIAQRLQVQLASEGRNFSRQLRSQSYVLPLAAATVAAILIFLPLAFWFVVGDRMAVQPGLGHQPPPQVAVHPIDATAELDELLAQVNALEVELNAAASRAQLLDARREADVLLATYNNW